MISGIYQAGRYVQVSGGTPSRPSIYNNSHSAQSAGSQAFTGQVRYNTSNQCLEVFDGNMWHQWSSSMANIGLTPDAERILDWAQKKMFEEAELKTRMERHPGLKDAFEKFKIMDALTLEEEDKAGMEETQAYMRAP